MSRVHSRKWTRRRAWIMFRISFLFRAYKKGSPCRHTHPSHSQFEFLPFNPEATHPHTHKARQLNCINWISFSPPLEGWHLASLASWRHVSPSDIFIARPPRPLLVDDDAACIHVRRVSVRVCVWRQIPTESRFNDFYTASRSSSRRRPGWME